MTDDVRTALNTYAAIETSSNGMISVPLESRAPAVFEALRKVLAIHSPTVGGKYCRCCGGALYPCPTVLAVSASLAPKED